jgi:hypothetical protein
MAAKSAPTAPAELTLNDNAPEVDVGVAAALVILDEDAPDEAAGLAEDPAAAAVLDAPGAAVDKRAEPLTIVVARVGSAIADGAPD